MPLAAFGVSLPLILAAVLIASGVAKLRHPDDLQGWRDLGVPAAFQRRWLLQLHPWGEIALGLALALLGGVLGLLAALVAVVLMASYTVLIVRVRAKTPDASCACFGESAPVTGWTVARNVWLTLLALGTAGIIWLMPLWGGALIVGLAFAAVWLLVLAIAAVTVFVIMRRDGRDAAPAPISAPATVVDEDADYIRMRTPAAPVTLANGTTVGLRRLAQLRPILLLIVSEGCGSCEPVIESIDRYRSLLPEVEVRFLLAAAPENSGLASTEEPQTLHDPNLYAIESLMDSYATPSAVLLGADGLLAGGPVMGGPAIEQFVRDIDESLHAADPAV